MVSPLQTTRGIVLDVDGTVYTLSKGIGEIYSEVLGLEGVSCDPKALTIAARKVWSEMVGDYLNVTGHHATTAEREQSFWIRYAAAVLGSAGVVPQTPTVTVRRIYEAFSQGKYRTLSPGVVEFVTRARAAGIVVIAASNNDERTKATLRDLGIYGSFDRVVVAADLCWKKPSVGYFSRLAEIMGIEASGCVHIGNDPELDVVAAERAGWSGVLYHQGAVTRERCLGSFFDAGALFGLPL